MNVTAENVGKRKQLGYSIVYHCHAGGCHIGFQRHETMKKAVDVIKQLKDRSNVLGVAEFNGKTYGETIGIKGLL